MKTFLRFLLPVCISLAGIFTACDRSSSREIHVIHIEGVQWACNITSSFGAFGSSYETEGKNELTLAASKGDLLYMLWEDEEFYYRYHPRDGKNLTVLFDTLDFVSVYLNEKLNYIDLTESSIPEKFKNLSRMEMSQLSTLYLNESLMAELIAMLEDYDSQIHGMGLVLKDGPGSEDLREWLSKYQPEFLILENPGQLPSPGSDYAMEGLELLWVQEYTNTLARAAQCCGDLESLILSGWEANPGELLPLSSMSSLQNLTLAESNMSSLQNIELPESLHSLNLISCTDLENIDQILSLPKLCRLNLTACENLKNLDELQKLENLRWISFPANTSQVQFRNLTEKLKQLEVVELIGCTEIVDLNPLQSAAYLGILALDLEEEQLSGLDSLQQLDLLIVSDDLFNENSNYINNLRSSLPDTKVVPGSGLCLGSGWLLLLLPLIIAFRFILHRKVRSSAAK
jgi:hypothetical protein